MKGWRGLTTFILGALMGFILALLGKLTMEFVYLISVLGGVTAGIRGPREWFEARNGKQ